MIYQKLFTQKSLNASFNLTIPINASLPLQTYRNVKIVGNIRYLCNNNNNNNNNNNVV